MQSISVLAILTVVFSCTTAQSMSWAQFMQIYKPFYINPGNQASYMSAFQDNSNTIQQHNAQASMGVYSFTLGPNKYAAMPTADFIQMMNGYRGANQGLFNQGLFNQGFGSATITTTATPLAPFNWTAKGYVTPVKDQGQCGSCWAFSTTGALEGQHFKATGALVSLSEQNLVDCSTAYGNQGCNGGLMDNAFKYIIAKQGIDTEASYPYTAVTGKSCKVNSATIGATMRNYTDIPSGSENALLQAVMNVGPISVAIDASHNSFQLYKSGIYNEPRCSSTQLDHGVLVVGYGTQSGQDYWLVKNSWGTTWGMSGYIMMSRNKSNQCGIATAASYPGV